MSAEVVEDAAVLIEDVGGGVHTLTLNRPGKLNALHSSVLAELSDGLRALRAARARAVVVVGSGTAFCAGADIDELAAHAGPQSFSDYLADMLAVFDDLASFPFLTIAGIHGVALGGGFELALACDLRVMARDASCGLPEVTLGALPGGGGIARALHLLPPGVAREVVLLGRRLDAQRCLDLGLVAELAPVGEVLEVCLALAREAPDVGAEAIALGKLLMSSIEQERTGAQSQLARAAISQMTRADSFRAGVEKFQARRRSRE